MKYAIPRASASKPSSAKKENWILIIVVGDRKSNNTRMLKEVAEKEAGISAILVENVEDLKAYDLSAYERIGVTAGASTPNVIVQEIIEKLPKGDFNSELVSEDYLRPKGKSSSCEEDFFNL